MSQEGMDQFWCAATPATRLRTIRNEVIVGHFEDAREKWLSRLAGEPGIVTIVTEILLAERHQANAIRLLQEMEDKAERRIGYWGRNDTPVGVALAGVLHYEAEPRSFTALCNGKRFDFSASPTKILTDSGYQIKTLRICKRCEKKQNEEANE